MNEYLTAKMSNCFKWAMRTCSILFADVLPHRLSHHLPQIQYHGERDSMIHRSANMKATSHAFCSTPQPPSLLWAHPLTAWPGHEASTAYGIKNHYTYKQRHIIRNLWPFKYSFQIFKRTLWTNYIKSLIITGEITVIKIVLPSQSVLVPSTWFTDTLPRVF